MSRSHPTPSPFRTHRGRPVAAIAALVLALAAGASGCARGGGEEGGDRPASEGARATRDGAPDAGEAAVPSHRDEVLAWRQRRLERLRAEDGWLTLVGLSWLEPGENTVGSEPTDGVPLPASAPADLGVITLRDGADGAPVFRAAPGAEVAHEGQPVAEIPLASDATGEPTVLQHGTVSFFVIEREGRLGVRVKDSQAPTRREFTGLDYYPISERWRIEATFEPYTPPRTVRVPNILGGPTEETAPGIATFAVGGETHRLEPITQPGTDRLFFVYGDETNGGETYGGGRFLYTDPPGPDGVVVLDFNQAYNPPCVFTPFATCPLPAPHNRLPFRVEAGEKAYGDPAHHAPPAVGDGAEGAS